MGWGHEVMPERTPWKYVGWKNYWDWGVVQVLLVLPLGHKYTSPGWLLFQRAAQHLLGEGWKGEVRVRRMNEQIDDAISEPLRDERCKGEYFGW